MSTNLRPSTHAFLAGQEAERHQVLPESDFLSSTPMVENWKRKLVLHFLIALPLACALVWCGLALTPDEPPATQSLAPGSSADSSPASANNSVRLEGAAALKGIQP